MKAGPQTLPERRYLLYCLICAVFMVLGMAALVAVWFWTDSRLSKIGPATSPAMSIAVEEIHDQSTNLVILFGFSTLGAFMGAVGFGILFFLTRKSNRLLQTQ